jgi:hypothetical protein
MARGGSIRNHIWDKLTGRTTAQDDFDIVYFDHENQDPSNDGALETAIKAALPSVLKISVKNQARMHLTNGEAQTNSFEEAISQWPETATAIAIRVDNSGKFEIFAPYGFSDLLNMVVRPTPYHQLNPRSYDARKLTKKWKDSWPELTILQ